MRSSRAGNVRGLHALKPDFLGVSRSSLDPVQVPFRDLGRCAGADLVQAVLSVYDNGAACTEAPQHLCDRLDPITVIDADELVGCAGRVREWSQQVHDRTYSQLTPGGCHVTHRRVVCGRK